MIASFNRDAHILQVGDLPHLNVGEEAVVPLSAKDEAEVMKQLNHDMRPRRALPNWGRPVIRRLRDGYYFSLMTRWAHELRARIHHKPGDKGTVSIEEIEDITGIPPEN